MAILSGQRSPSLLADLAALIRWGRAVDRLDDLQKRDLGGGPRQQIAVAGATGNTGTLTVAALERDGHDVTRISRSLGVDLSTGDGVDDALAGVEAVVDVTNSPAASLAETVAYFGTATRNLLAAEERAGVRHHVLLSIAGIDRIEGNAHYAGKREQERLVAAGPVPWTIVPATQFHDFAAMVASWSEQNGVAAIAPLLVQPVAPADVADILAEIAVGEPQGRYVDVAGPEPQGPGGHGPAHRAGAWSHGEARSHLVGSCPRSRFSVRLATLGRAAASLAGWSG